VNTYWTAGGEEPAEYRTVSCDIVGNILVMTPDNAIEVDMGHHNIRIMRNLSTEVWGGFWSNQTLFGGPAYWIRNIAYGGWNAMWKNDAGPVGVIAYHNTFLGGQPKTWPPKRAEHLGTAPKVSVNKRFINYGNLTLNPEQSAELLTRPPEIVTGKQIATVFTPGDFAPTSTSPAIDKAPVVLPNVNDDYEGEAPDLGAHESGKPVPHYGPRRR
jgi:hypothetical protein